MKTVQDIQKEVLATAQVTLDELRASIEKFWEQGWNTYQEALSLYKSSEWYIHNHELRVKDYESIKRLYTMIAETVDKTMNPYGKKVAFISEKQSWILAVAAIENNITL